MQDPLDLADARASSSHLPLHLLETIDAGDLAPGLP
jgi:hypothetical protein